MCTRIRYFFSLGNILLWEFVSASSPRCRVTDPSLSVQGIRKSISANVHVKAILSKLADELGGGAGEEGKRAARISLQTVYNIHKVMRKLEVTVKNAHVRVEEPARGVVMPLDEANAEAGTGTGPSTSTPAVAFGICIRGISLGLDERADAEAGGGSGGERWFGKKFRAMETALLGSFCEILMANYSRCHGAAIVLRWSVQVLLSFSWVRRFQLPLARVWCSAPPCPKSLSRVAGGAGRKRRCCCC